MRGESFSDVYSHGCRFRFVDLNIELMPAEIMEADADLPSVLAALTTMPARELVSRSVWSVIWKLNVVSDTILLKVSTPDGARTP